MKTQQHTPGPWYLIPFQEPTFTVKSTGEQKRRTIYQLKIGGTVNGKFRTVCDAQEMNKGVSATQEDIANARLIAAAPELLAALDCLTTGARSNYITQADIDAAIAALTKATI